MTPMIWVCDSLFPSGAFTLSNGLETMVQNGDVADEASLDEYVTDLLKLLPFGNTGVMMLAYRNCSDRDFLRKLDAYVTAFRSPREVREGSQRLARRFIKLLLQIGSFPDLKWYSDEIEKGHCCGDHAVSMGLYAAGAGVSAEEGASVYTYSQINAAVTNAVKLIPLSQVSGQRILFHTEEKIRECVKRAGSVTMDDIGMSGPGIDISAIEHERLYSRMYMS